MFFIKNAFMIAPLALSIGMAALGFGTSTRTISNANWSTFRNTVGEVRTALYEKAVTTKGEEAAAGMTRTDAQVYNFVAKGGIFLDKKSEETSYQWISRAQGNALACTQITEDVIENALGLKNLNKVKVNTEKATGVTASYFVTGSGDVFVWPPFEYDNELYVNEETQLTKADGTPIKADSKDAAKIYKDGYTFKVGTVNITVSNKESLPTFDIQNTTPEALAKMPAIAYKDGANAASPVGLEKIEYSGSSFAKANEKNTPYIKREDAKNASNVAVSERARYIRKVNEIGEIETAFIEKAVTVKGYEAMNGYTRTDAQVANVLAKGLISSSFDNYEVKEDIWPSRAEAEEKNVTQISRNTIEKILGLTGLESADNYYVTKDWKVFVWPPIEFGGEYFIDSYGKLVDKNGELMTVFDREKMDKGEFTFEYNGVNIHISNGEVVCDK